MTPAIMTLASRRDFLRSTATLTAAATCGSLAFSSASPARAIEPIERNGAAKFKFSLAAYSYRDLLTSKPSKLNLNDFISDCAKMGLEGVELTSYYFPQPTTPEYLCKLRDHAFRLGLDISGTAVGNDFCYPPGEARDKQLQLVKRWVDNAAILGAPVIRIFSGSVRQGQTAAEAHKLAVQGIEECCEYAGTRGVHLALENHGGLTSEADGMLTIVRDVKSPWFGVNLDTGNFHGQDVYADLDKLAPYAMNVQVKVVVSGADKKSQPSDFGKLAQILKSTGYRGYIVLEYEEAEDPRVACPRFIAELRKAFA